MKFTALSTVVILAATMSVPTMAGEKDGWVNLFDGKTLNGWIQKNGTARYSVSDGTIVGVTNEGSPNSFLCSEKEYGNFELEFEVKVHDNLNSGVQIRSKTKEPKGDAKFGRVYGPQVEIEASRANGAEAGYVYGEATGLGWLTSKADLKPHKTMKDGDWNAFRVVAKGRRIQTWINGKAIADLTHDEVFTSHPKGFIGLQVHGIRKGTGPFDVAWRKIRIRELSDE